MLGEREAESGVGQLPVQLVDFGVRMLGERGNLGGGGERDEYAVAPAGAGLRVVVHPVDADGVLVLLAQEQCRGSIEGGPADGGCFGLGRLRLAPTAPRAAVDGAVHGACGEDSAGGEHDRSLALLGLDQTQAAQLGDG